MMAIMMTIIRMMTRMMGNTINPALLEEDCCPAVSAVGGGGDFVEDVGGEGNCVEDVGGEGNCIEDVGGEGDGFPIRDMYNVVICMTLRENGKYRNKRKIGCLDRIQTNFLCVDLHTLTRDPHIFIVATPSSGCCTRTLLHI